MVDLFENLPQLRTMPPAAAEQRRELLERHISANSRGSSRPRIFTRTAIVGAAASMVLFGGAAAAYVAFAPADVPVADSTRCYTKASLETTSNGFYGTTVTLAHSASGQRLETSAIQMCTGLWRGGFITPNSDVVGGPDAGKSEHPVPPLVACVYDGIAAVFPGDETTCQDLGLPRLVE